MCGRGGGGGSCRARRLHAAGGCRREHPEVRSIAVLLDLIVRGGSRRSWLCTSLTTRSRTSSSTTIAVHHEPRYRGAPTRILLLLMAPLLWTGRHRLTRPYIAGEAPRRGSSESSSRAGHQEGRRLARSRWREWLSIFFNKPKRFEESARWSLN